MVTISLLKRPSRAALADIRALLADLRGEDKTRPTPLQMGKIVRDKHTLVIVAKDSERIIGMAMLFVMQKFGKRIGYVEDVVVSGEYRGQGLGKRVMRAVIAAARTHKVATVYLTSRPARVAANKLYRKLGFELVKTNPYRLKL